jgi:hypothetical protein
VEVKGKDPNEHTRLLPHVDLKAARFCLAGGAYYVGNGKDLFVALAQTILGLDGEPPESRMTADRAVEIITGWNDANETEIKHIRAVIRTTRRMAKSRFDSSRRHG